MARLRTTNKRKKRKLRSYRQGPKNPNTSWSCWRLNNIWAARRAKWPVDAAGE